MTEVEEMTKQVDLVYKNILEKFNPAARQLISAGKAYLKALHGAMSASKVYLEAISKLARQSTQQCAWGGSADIGACLMQMVDVYKEIQAQQMNILKAFYVDLVVPLENNLDRDTKVVQSEQKKFLATHKQRSESYAKAAGIVKKQRKKHRAGKNAIDKDIKHLQSLEEEKLKLDGFVEQSLKSAITQERRRYGFVLERQCSLAKHYLAFHSKGNSLLQHHVDVWQDTAKSREELPDRIQGLFPPRSRAREPEGIYSSPMGIEDDRLSVSSQLRKARSMDASCIDLSTIEAHTSRPLTRARSDFHLDQSNPSPLPPVMAGGHYGLRPKSMAVPDDASRRTLARALYAYLSSGENQLSFHEGDIIALIGEKNKGWQYGENLRTQRCGWFPVAYTELLHEEDDSALGYKAVGRGSWRRWLADDPPGHAAPPEPNATTATKGPPTTSSSPSACPGAAPRAPSLSAASKPAPQTTAAPRPASDAVAVVVTATPSKEKIGTNSAATASDACATATATPLPKPQSATSTAPTTQPQPHVRFSAHPVLPHPNNHFYTLPNRARSNLASKKTLLKSHGSSSEDSGTSEPRCSSSMYTFPSSTVSPDLISDCPSSKDPATTKVVNEKRKSITLTHPLTAAFIEK